MAKIAAVEVAVGAEVVAVEEDFMATPAKRLTMPTIPMFLSTTKRSIASIIRKLNVSIKYDVTVLGTLLI